MYPEYALTTDHEVRNSVHILSRTFEERSNTPSTVYQAHNVFCFSFVPENLLFSAFGSRSLPLIGLPAGNTDLHPRLLYGSARETRNKEYRRLAVTFLR